MYIRIKKQYLVLALLGVFLVVNVVIANHLQKNSIQDKSEAGLNAGGQLVTAEEIEQCRKLGIGSAVIMDSKNSGAFFQPLKDINAQWFEGLIFGDYMANATVTAEIVSQIDELHQTIPRENPPVGLTPTLTPREPYKGVRVLLRFYASKPYDWSDNPAGRFSSTTVANYVKQIAASVADQTQPIYFTAGHNEPNCNEYVDPAKEVAFFNSIKAVLDGVTNVKLISPMIDIHCSGKLADLTPIWTRYGIPPAEQATADISVKEYINATSEIYDQVDFVNVNAYNGNGLNAVNGFNTAKGWFGGGKKFIISESGAFDSNFPSYGNSIQTLIKDPDVEGLLIFNGFGYNPSFTYHNGLRCNLNKFNSELSSCFSKTADGFTDNYLCLDGGGSIGSGGGGTGSGSTDGTGAGSGGGTGSGSGTGTPTSSCTSNECKSDPVEKARGDTIKGKNDMTQYCSKGSFITANDGDTCTWKGGEYTYQSKLNTSFHWGKACSDSSGTLEYLACKASVGKLQQCENQRVITLHGKRSGYECSNGTYDKESDSVGGPGIAEVILPKTKGDFSCTNNIITGQVTYNNEKISLVAGPNQSFVIPKNKNEFITNPVKILVLGNNNPLKKGFTINVLGAGGYDYKKHGIDKNNLVLSNLVAGFSYDLYINLRDKDNQRCMVKSSFKYNGVDHNARGIDLNDGRPTGAPIDYEVTASTDINNVLSRTDFPVNDRLTVIRGIPFEVDLSSWTAKQKITQIKVINKPNWVILKNGLITGTAPQGETDEQATIVYSYKINGQTYQKRITLNMVNNDGNYIPLQIDLALEGISGKDRSHAYILLTLQNEGIVVLQKIVSANKQGQIITFVDSTLTVDSMKLTPLNYLSQSMSYTIKDSNPKFQQAFVFGDLEKTLTSDKITLKDYSLFMESYFKQYPNSDVNRNGKHWVDDRSFIIINLNKESK